MPLARLFLLATSILYLGLGLWCAVAPEQTSRKVGLERIGEAGRSEFMTVYGGLEVGMGLMLAALALKKETLPQALLACALLHGGLVAFRAGSFLFYDAMHGITLRLAIGEWVIFLGSVLLLVAGAGNQTEDSQQE